MICCSDPNCAEDAGLTIQRSIDPAAVAYCLPHGYQRAAELKPRLENYQLVSIVAMPPSELELAQARLAELEAKGPDAGDGAELADQLETALHTLELQSKTLDKARTELADRDTALSSLRRELERTRADLQRVTGELDRVRAERAAAMAAPPAEGPRITPAPPTRPDPTKP